MRPVGRPIPVDPLTASFWRAEAAARGVTLEQFLREAVSRLLSSEPPTAGSVPSRSAW